jgi:flagellar motor switch protein FliN/FliY
MSTAAAPTPALEIVEYARGWGVGLACAQQAIPGAICEVHTEVPPGATNAEKQDLWITATSQIDLGGSIAFRTDRTTALRFSPTPSSKPETASAELAGETRASLLACIRKASEGVKTSALHEGKDEFLVEFRDSAPEAKAVGLWLQLTSDAGSPMVAELWLDNAIVRRLLSLDKLSVSPSEPSAGAAVAKLGMLMGVELSVTVRFGGRRMLLKDILDLCAGSVVELDQQVQEPVDLLLDGKVIARGEVVVVDGNYGLRVNEVLLARRGE